MLDAGVHALVGVCFDVLQQTYNMCVIAADARVLVFSLGALEGERRGAEGECMPAHDVIGTPTSPIAFPTHSCTLCHQGMMCRPLFLPPTDLPGEVGRRGDRCG